jgi:hypothetical protein
VSDEDGLAKLLGDAPPAGVAALPLADRRSLADVISTARRKQSEDLAASFEATLKYVPFPLRPVVKRALFG